MYWDEISLAKYTITRDKLEEKALVVFSSLSHNHNGEIDLQIAAV